jgi:hypothetical protein
MPTSENFQAMVDAILEAETAMALATRHIHDII